ncbi:hypothetical protein QFZ77_001546 [Paenibacillus sp. V4I3]|uniref:hypothetical protein n=1 Tax=unclassified Paenibacillus TaxID=185978 RepID=UPI00277D465B|nr:MULTISPECIES: hypothetical protein [unclassified Paenibacillus]MDQ0872887.1 hypothetical protein [Paenibacillus sp. V4I3]MDQ0891195.1 hypothetical protein [Paenibacillus sp. V4I9]
MKSRQSHKPRVKRTKGLLQISAASSSSAGRAARQSKQFASGIMGKYGFWRNNYLGLLALIFKQKGILTDKELSALTESNDQSWVIQLQLQLQSLQHPESAPLITKKQTIRQLQQLITNSGYRLASQTTVDHFSSQPDVQSSHQQMQVLADKQSKKKGRKSKKNADLSVNQMNLQATAAHEILGEKQAMPPKNSNSFNYVNKGISPLIQRSIRQITASIGMLSHAQSSNPNQQSQSVNGPQHTKIHTQRSIVHRAAPLVNHVQVVKHVDAIRHTSQWIEEFQEGKPSAGLPDAKAGHSAIAPSVVSTTGMQPSLLHAAKLYLNGVAQTQTLQRGKQSLQPRYVNSLPKLGEGPFSNAEAPASVHFIRSLLVRNMANVNDMEDVSPTALLSPIGEPKSDGKLNRKEEASTARGFLAASQQPLAINAARLTSTLPFAMHASTSRGARQSVPHVWRKREEQLEGLGQERLIDQVVHQVDALALVRRQEQEELVERIRDLEQERVLERSQERDQGSEQVQDRAQERSLEQDQGIEQWQDRVQEQVEELVHMREQEQLQERLRGQEQEKMQEWDHAQDNEQIQVQNQVQNRAQNQVQNQVQDQVPNQNRNQDQVLNQLLQYEHTHQQVLLEAISSAGQKLEMGTGQQPISEASSYENWETRSSSREGNKRNRGSSMMERLIKLVTKQVAEQGIESTPYNEAAFPSQIHRKPNVMENGLESVVKIQSNEKLLKQLVQRQKQRQNSSNDSFVGSIHTVSKKKLQVIYDHLAMTTHIPRIMRRENIMLSNADNPLAITRSAANPNVELRMQSHSESVPLQPNRSTRAAVEADLGTDIYVKAQGKSGSAQLSSKPSAIRVTYQKGNPREGYLASLQASSFLQDSQRVLRAASKPEEQNETSMKMGRNFPVAARSVILRDQTSDALGAMKPLEGYRASLQASIQLQEVGRVFRKAAGNEVNSELMKQQYASQVEEKLTPAVGSIRSTPTLGSELAAKMAESSVKKIGTSLNLAAEAKRKADSENRLDGFQTSLQARAGSLKQETRRIFRTPVESEGSRQSEKGRQQRARANEDRLGTKPHSVLPSSQSLASEIATKVVENSLKKIGPSLTVNAGQIGLQRSFSHNTELSEPASVRAIWRQAEKRPIGETGTTIEAVMGTIRERANEKVGNKASKKVSNDSTSSDSASNEEASHTSLELVRGTISRTPVDMVRRTGRPTGIDRVREQQAAIQRKIDTEVATTIRPEIGGARQSMTQTGTGEAMTRQVKSRTSSGEAGRTADIHTGARKTSQRLDYRAAGEGVAGQTTSQTGRAVWRRAQVEHVQRQVIVDDSERELQAGNGSENRVEAGGLQSDSAERTIRARVSALEEERAQGFEAAAASRAAGSVGGARAALAPTARQPVSMTPRVMPLLASSAGALRAAPAGLTQAAAIGSAAWATTAGAQRSASMTHSSSVSLAAAAIKPLPTQVQRQTLAGGVPNAGQPNQGAPLFSGTPSARQDYLASQQLQPTLEHKQAPAVEISSALAESPLEMDWLRTKASADEASTPEAPVHQAAPELSAEQLQELMKQLPQLDIAKIADKVYREIEKKMKFERQRRGI